MSKLGSSIRRAFTRNWTLKLSALGIAVLLWFSVRFEARNQQDISNVLVRVDLSDPAWTTGVDGPDPAGVSVRFRGPALELLRLSTDRPVIVVPIPEVTAADTTVVLQPGWVRFGERPGVAVEGISPPLVRLRFEPVQRTTLPPAIRLSGALGEELAFAAPPSATVSSLRISGPSSLLEALDSIPLLPVSLDGISGSAVVPVLVDTASVPGIQVTPIALEIDFRVEERIERVLEVTAPAPPEGLVGYPETVSVTVRGARSLVEGLSTGALRIEADFSNDPVPEAGIFDVTFRLEGGLPDLLDGEVASVRVEREEPS